MVAMTLRSLAPAALAVVLAAVLPVPLGTTAAYAGSAASPGAVSERLDAFGRDASGFFDRVFGADPAPAVRHQPAEPTVTVAQMSGPDLIVRLERLENQIRQLTGMIEQLQFRNQQLEQQLKRVQDDTEYRFQEIGGRGGARPGPVPTARPTAPGQLAPPAAQPTPGRRGDAFDPVQNPAAPGAPHTLGAVAAAPEPPAPPVGAPGGRGAGAPLDLGTLSGQAANDPSLAPGTAPGPVAAAPASPGLLPPPPPRSMSATGAQPQATLPPTATPKDEYDLAYGYVLRKDYALAEDAFRAFIKKYPSNAQAADANYWLGETLFQRQRYRDAAESFLTVSTKYETAGKAPDALLRLGQSLAAMKDKEMACATFREIGRKYPRASPSVKQTADREQKRAGC